MTSKEIVKRAVQFETPPRLPYAFPDKYGSDIVRICMAPYLDARPKEGVDEWGAVWRNIGHTSFGEVIDFPLKDWADYDKLNIPNANGSNRWDNLWQQVAQVGDKFILAQGVSLYERVHFIRGLENTWVDIYEAPDKLGKLVDILVEMNLIAIRHYADAGADAIIWPDDWGLQDRLMISPEKWHQIWKYKYAKVYDAAHKAGLLTFLHSCGNIVSILDDLIDAGLDVIEMHQQQNMGLELLGDRFGGRITFFCPVDIQTVMPHANLDDIRAYCRKMVKCLGRPEGGFIAAWYPDPGSVGHSQQAIDVMCEEFLNIAKS
jgi:hypothetical protein